MSGSESGFPSVQPPVPDAVRRIAAGGTLRAVWSNGFGDLTFEVRAEDQLRFIKWSPATSRADLAAEAARLEWASQYANVPRLIDAGTSDEGTWMVTEALPGSNAVEQRWKEKPSVAVTAIGQALRVLHESLPVEACPFEWSAETRLADAQRRLGAGEFDMDWWRGKYGDVEVSEVLDRVSTPPPIDMLVVCHGDTCAPNILIGDDGVWTGMVDVGLMGVADRWSDLAIATWSTQWNYGPGWEQGVLDAYGIEPDDERTEYYRLLWDLGP